MQVVVENVGEWSGCLRVEVCGNVGIRIIKGKKERRVW